MNEIKKQFNLVDANSELQFQDAEREKRAAELMIANKELAFQNEEKEKRAAELLIANKELAFQNEEKEKRAAELLIANKELAFQNEEKEKRAAELLVANKELAFQNDEKEKRAAELMIANKELAFQNDEKEKRAAELLIANRELAFQNKEKEKRAAELLIANKELAFQNEEKEKRALELLYSNLQLENAKKDIENLNEDLEQKVINRTIELETANKELGAFSYSVSHDLRAPIRAISGFAKILEEDYIKNFDTEGRNILHTILRNSVRLGELIDELLEFSKIGRKELTVSKIDMAEQVRLVFEDYFYEDGERKPQLSFRSILPALGDKILIKQVWVNLLSNAIKYSKNNLSASIEIGSSENNGQVTYYIKDNGVGFDMKYYNKLFGVFQRLHSQAEFKGTGIGLAIVQKIIQKNKGNVWAESIKDQGSTFYFSLPSIQNYEL